MDTPTPKPFAALLTTALFALAALSGCLGDVQAVYVPEGTLPDGWTHTNENQSEEAAGGAVDIIINQYEHDGTLKGEVYLVAVTDVPFVDEHEKLEEQIESFAKKQDVQLTRTGSTSFTLDNGQATKVTEYDIVKTTAAGDVNGKAWFVKWEDDFVAGGLGYATTEIEGPLGSREDTTLWREAQAILKSADW